MCSASVGGYIGGPAPVRSESERRAGRLTAAFMLRWLKLIAEFVEGDFVRGIILTAIVSANTAHLDRRRSEIDLTFDEVGSVPPDSERRPVSVLALAQSLGLSFETVRRHVNALRALGLCVRVKGGIIVPSAVLASPAMADMLAANAGNLRRLARDLDGAGVTRA